MKTIAKALVLPQVDRPLAQLALGAYMLLLLIGTHTPGAGGPPVAAVSDKVLHLAAFAVMGVLFGVACTPRGGRLSVSTGLWAWGVILLFAAFDEITQPLFLRSCDLYDWLADAAGAGAALVVYGVWTRLR